MIAGAKEIISGLVSQAQLLHDKNEITEAELASVKLKAGLSDSAWDKAVADAKAKLN
jgi:hypothetical protein